MCCIAEIPLKKLHTNLERSRTMARRRYHSVSPGRSAQDRFNLEPSADITNSGIGEESSEISTLPPTPCPLPKQMAPNPPKDRRVTFRDLDERKMSREDYLPLQPQAPPAHSRRAYPRVVPRQIRRPLYAQQEIEGEIARQVMAKIRIRIVIGLCVVMLLGLAVFAYGCWYWSPETTYVRRVIATRS